MQDKTLSIQDSLWKDFIDGACPESRGSERVQAETLALPSPVEPLMRSCITASIFSLFSIDEGRFLGCNRHGSRPLRF